MTSSKTKTSRAPRRGFGRIEKRSSGRYRAAYVGPDGLLHRAPHTFEAKVDAETWLADRRREVVNRTWNPPADGFSATKPRPVTFGEYAAGWMRGRDLKPRTRGTYESLLRLYLLPTFGKTPLTGITSAKVRDWHGTVAEGRPATRAHAYGLLRTILGSAVDDEVLAANPVHIRGAGAVKRARKVEPLTLPQLARLVDAMPEEHRVLTLLAAWCGLRFGELTELRRRDVDLKAGVLRVRRAVVTVREDPDDPLRLDPDTTRCPCRPGCLVGPPKSEAGVRDVAIPPHLLPAVKRHMLAHAAPGADGLVFPGPGGGHLPRHVLYGHGPRPSTRNRDGIRRGAGFFQARVDAGVPSVRWHDLRHTGATLAARSGATLAELMNRIGHSTHHAALRYQHAAQDRDLAIAAALSKLAEAVEGTA